jgi:hypothetical protein
MDRNVGLLIIAVGVGVIVLGLLVWSGALSWFGRLPGDIQHDSGGTRVFVPITSMIVVSVVLTIIVNVVGRFFR